MLFSKSHGLTVSKSSDGKRKPLASIEHKLLDRGRVAQDGVGRFQLPAHFIGLKGALSETGAVFPFASDIEVPASVQRCYFGDFQAKLHLRKGFRGGAPFEK